jgi:hypothetical protein
MSWTAALAFLLRQAGFPFDLLEAALVPGTLEEPAGAEGRREVVHAAAGWLRDGLRTMEDRPLARRIGSAYQDGPRPPFHPERVIEAVRQVIRRPRGPGRQAPGCAAAAGTGQHR